ncbi:hypothetical protein DSO57_1005148 [Entomophthora muscae]|uniref:Uncharacterized protein n=1 Tax=Entomophthora muscae TaxID=34485 RepID=A0ACC2RZ85_9FUNG|nr:hypothetical protein DSO57_1005148 [Entomophthora muscae]
MQTTQLYNKESIFYTNLQLLGFEAFKESELVKQYGNGSKEIRLDEKMFVQSTNTQKATELVLYFLWQSLDAKEFNKSVKMFPPQDHKESREFRMICFKWLEKLKAGHHIPPHISLFVSDLEESRGERFGDLMTALSSYVLSVKLKHKVNLLAHMSYDYQIPHQFDLFEKYQSFEADAIKSEIKSESDFFLLLQQTHLGLQKEWLEEGKRIDEMYCSLDSKKRKATEECLKLKSESSSISFPSTLESVSSNWANVERLAESCKADFDIITGVIEDRAKQLVVNGDCYKKIVPESDSTSRKKPIKLDDLYDAITKKLPSASSNFDSNTVSKVLNTLEPCVSQHKTQLGDLALLKERLKAKVSSLKQSHTEMQIPSAKRFDCKEFLIEVAKVLK